MLENFIYAKEKSLFEEKLNNGEVLDEAIAFIEDTKEIWTHGSYFSNLNDVLKATEQSLTEEQKAQVKANLGIVESEGVEDVPTDGKKYLRSNKEWKELSEMAVQSDEIGKIWNSIYNDGITELTEEQYNAILEFYNNNKKPAMENGAETEIAYAFSNGGPYSELMFMFSISSDEYSIYINVISIIDSGGNETIGTINISHNDKTISWSVFNRSIYVGYGKSVSMTAGVNDTYGSSVFNEFTAGEIQDDSTEDKSISLIHSSNTNIDGYQKRWLKVSSNNEGGINLQFDSEGDSDEGYYQKSENVSLKTAGEGNKFLSDNGEYKEISIPKGELPLFLNEIDKLRVEQTTSASYPKTFVDDFISSIESINYQYLDPTGKKSGYYRMPLDLDNWYMDSYFEKSDAIVELIGVLSTSSNLYATTYIKISHQLFLGFDVYVTMNYEEGYDLCVKAKKVRRESFTSSFDSVNDKMIPDNITGNGIFTGIPGAAHYMIDRFKSGSIYSYEVNLNNHYRLEYNSKSNDISFDFIGKRDMTIYNYERNHKICRVDKNGVHDAILKEPYDSDRTTFDAFFMCGNVYLKANSNGFTITNDNNVDKTFVVIIENNESSNIDTSINNVPISVQAGSKIVMEIIATYKDILINKKYVN